MGCICHLFRIILVSFFFVIIKVEWKEIGRVALWLRLQGAVQL